MWGCKISRGTMEGCAAAAALQDFPGESPCLSILIYLKGVFSKSSNFSGGKSRGKSLVTIPSFPLPSQKQSNLSAFLKAPLVLPEFPEGSLCPLLPLPAELQPLLPFLHASLGSFYLVQRVFLSVAMSTELFL